MREQVGVVSVLSLLLYTHGRSYGALNLYCGGVDAFTGEDVARAKDLTSDLAGAIADSRELQNLDKSTLTPALVGQAQGILMERYTIGADEAFVFLGRICQGSNRTVAQIAHELVDTRRLPQVDPVTRARTTHR